MTAVRVGLVAALALAAVACSHAHRTAKNGLIAANWQGQGIFLIDPDSGHRHPIQHTESAAGLAWAPDGQTIAFDLPAKVLGVDVYTIRSDGSDLQLIARNAYAPAWSPDGKRLLIERGSKDFRVDLFTVRPDGRGLRHLVRATGDVFSPVWSPDGKRIAFLGGDGRLNLVDADGEHRRRLAGSFGGHLSWSPDGSHLAFELRGEAPNWGDIGVVDLASGERRNLTHRPGDDSGPAWSPDGKQIAFLADLSCAFTGTCNPDWQEEGPRELWLMDADGGHLHQLTRDGGFYDDPAWQPR